jgi:hypothetical protein
LAAGPSPDAGRLLDAGPGRAFPCGRDRRRNRGQVADRPDRRGRRGQVGGVGVGATVEKGGLMPAPSVPADPIRALVGNLLWAGDGSVWAAWRVDPVAYRYATSADKTSHVRGAATLLRALRGEPLLLSLAGPVGADDIAARCVANVDVRRHPVHGEITAAYRDLLDEVDLRERTYWLAMPLPSANRLAAAAGIFAGAGGQIGRAFGITPAAPDLAEVRARAAQAAKVARAVPGLAPATPEEILWIHRRAARRGTFAEPTLTAARRRARPGAVWRRGRLRVPGYAALGEVHLDEGGRHGGRDPHRDGDDEQGLGARLSGAAWRWARDGASAASPFTHRFVRVATPDGGDSYQAFLVLSDLPEEWAFPGGEWLASLHDDTPFPIDWAIRAVVRPGREARIKVARKRRQNADQMGEYTIGDNEDPDTFTEDLPHWVLAGQRQLEHEQSGLDANSAEVEYEITVILGVWADTLDECEERAEALRVAFNDELIATRPTGNQIDAYAAMLPGVPTPSFTAGYTQFLLGEDLAKAMPFPGGRFGDGSGQLLGLTVDAGIAEPVQLNIADWTSRDISASLGLFGELGSGKSVTLKKILADIGAAGGRTIGWDRTRTREQITFLRAVFGDTAVQVADLANPSGFSLDPLRVLPGTAGEQAAETFCAQLLGVSATGERGTLLAEALQAIAGRPDRCMAALVDQLAETGRGNPAAEGLARQLRAAARRQATAVVFDPDLPPLHTGRGHIVFATYGMTVPKLHEIRSEAHMGELPFAHRFGRAVLTLTALIAKTIAFADARQFCMVHADECYWLTREGEGSPGYDTVLELVRDGRKNRAGILLAGHDPGDCGDLTLLGLLSAVLVGRQRNRDLAARYVAALGVTDPDVVEQLVRAITQELSPLSHRDPASGDLMVEPGREGEFLARFHHRIGRLRVLIPPVARIDAAIRTTPELEAAVA